MTDAISTLPITETPLINHDHASKAKDEPANNVEKPSSIIREGLPKYGYSFAAFMHALAGITHLKKIVPNKVRDKLGKLALWTSKAVTSANYLAVAYEAWQNNRAFDFISKIMEPAGVLGANLDNVHLFRGLSTAMIQFLNSQYHLVKKRYESKTEDLKAHFDAFLKLLTENLTGGFDRHYKAFADPKAHDEGHSMALSGYFIGLGSLIGILFGFNKRNMWNKLGGIIRNLGGFFGDFTMIMKPDPDERKSGILYSINAVVDVVQRFLPQNIADMLNHFNMIANNMATHYFAKLSRKMTDGTYVTIGDDKPKSLEKGGLDR